MGSKNKLDKAVVVDLEAACWEPRDSKPENERSDIIEIGACFLDLQTGKVSQKTSYIIKPKNSKISKFCTELTSLTQEDVDKGIPFSDACNKLAKEFGTKNRLWISWGDYDRKHFVEECGFYGIKYPFGSRHINLKTLFSVMNGLTKEVGVQRALKYCDMEFKGTHHRGDDDAYNIARIFAKMLRK